MNNSKLFNFLVRTRDIVISFFGLLLLSPVFLVIAIWIKRDSEGPVFFRGGSCWKKWKDFPNIKISDDA